MSAWLPRVPLVAALCVAWAPAAVGQETPGGEAGLLGEALFLSRCAGCHGETGDGKGPLARALNPRPHLTWKGKAFDADGNGVGNEDADLRLMIRNGAETYGGSTVMVPNPDLSQAQIESLVEHIRELERRYREGPPGGR